MERGNFGEEANKSFKIALSILILQTFQVYELNQGFITLKIVLTNTYI